MKKILKGYVSLFREMLNLPNDASFLSSPASLVLMILVCGVIGLIRNWISASWKVLPGFYGFHFDMIWTMFIFPIQLFLFPSALLHWFLSRNHSHIRVEVLFNLSFHLQVLHLIIPFFDWLGYHLGMPWAYTIGTDIVRTRWYTNLLYMTPGVLLAWWVTGYLVAKVLNQRLGVGWPTTLFASLTTFLFILFPTYLLFPSFNTLFNEAFGLWFWYPQDYLFDSPSWFLHWGYGTYFALTAILGLVYYIKHQTGENA